MKPSLELAASVRPRPGTPAEGFRRPRPGTPAEEGIADLFPAYVATAELMEDVDEALLYRDELALIADAAPKRRREFAAGRVCARRAMADLGLPPQPITRSADRDPVWPDGVVGTITHCSGYRAAAVAHATQVRAIGIDAEPHAPLPDGVLRLIATPHEINVLRGLVSLRDDVHWDRLLFSAKEAVYKAHFPLHRARLGFLDVAVTVDATAGTFVAHADGWWRELPGRWLIRDGLVRTAVSVSG